MISRLSANCVFTYVILYWWLTQESPTTIYTYTYWPFNDWLYIRYQIDNRVASTLFQNWIFFQMKKKKQFSFALFYSISVNSWKTLIIQFQFFIARRRNKASTQRQLVCDAIFRTNCMRIQNVTFCDMIKRYEWWEIRDIWFYFFILFDMSFREIKTCYFIICLLCLHNLKIKKRHYYEQIQNYLNRERNPLLYFYGSIYKQ